MKSTLRDRRDKNNFWNTHHRCSACGSVIETNTRPEGGRFVPQSEWNGTRFVPADDQGGCWFCGCPAHRSGGKLGDMETPFM